MGQSPDVSEFFPIAAHLASWYSWLTDRMSPLSRRAREVVLRIIHTLEFRVALLHHQVKMMRAQS